MKDKDIKTWVMALRSGEYIQGRGRLCKTVNGKDYHCCLGVMIDELAEGDWISLGESWLFYGSEWMPPPHTLKGIGLPQWAADALSGMNDLDKKSFEEIADWIEGHREELINEG